MDVSKLTPGERIVLLVGALLIVDLIFLPWHNIDIGGISVAGIDTTRSGVQSPNALYGLIAVLLAIVMIGQIVATKIMSASLPNPPVPWSQVHRTAGAIVVGALAIKLIAETEFLGFGAFLGLLLAAGLAFGGYLIHKESPGVV